MNLTLWKTIKLSLGLYWRTLFGRRTNKRYPCVTCGLPYLTETEGRRIDNHSESHSASSGKVQPLVATTGQPLLKSPGA